MKNALNDKRLSTQFTAQEKILIETMSSAGLEFVKFATNATAEEYEWKTINYGDKLNPILMRVFKASGFQLK